MANLICDEMRLFMACVTLGVLLAVGYDGIRIFRMFISHKDAVVDIEDLLFWICTAWITFRVLFAYNKGVLRMYAFLGMALGFFAYNQTISPRFLRVVEKILPYFQKTKKIICKPFTKICRWIRKGLKNLKTQVKMAIKSR